MKEQKMEELFKRISAEEFAKLDFRKVTLVDLREPDEVLVSRIQNSIQFPRISLSMFTAEWETGARRLQIFLLTEATM